MADNFSDLDPWIHGCISEAAFARENDALTEALCMSLLSGSSSSTAICSDFLSSPTSTLLLPSAGDPPPRLSGPPIGRIGKRRKSRASKRTSTTYIAADPTNFRELVQQVTGPAPGDATWFPVHSPPRPSPADGHVSCLPPTLDTSAFLLNPPGLPRPNYPMELAAEVAVVADMGHPFIGPPCTLPTPSSWAAIER